VDRRRPWLDAHAVDRRVVRGSSRAVDRRKLWIALNAADRSGGDCRTLVL
jgi:hypothetical protein